LIYSYKVKNCFGSIPDFCFSLLVFICIRIFNFLDDCFSRIKFKRLAKSIESIVCIQSRLGTRVIIRGTFLRCKCPTKCQRISGHRLSIKL